MGILQYSKEVTFAVESKTLNALQSWTKYLAKSKKIKQNVTMVLRKTTCVFSILSLLVMMPLTFDIAVKLLSDKSVSFCFGLLSTHRLYTSFMSTVSDYL